MAYTVHQHLAYNTWANAKFAAVLSELDDKIYFQDNKSSFHSIAKTVLHIWGAQVIWLNRMHGLSLTAWPAADFQDNKVESLKSLAQSSDDLMQYVSSKNESFLSSTYAYKNMKGDPFEDRYEDTLFHIVNHGTYHRGQIIIMLREAGETTLPATDLIHYLRGVQK